MEKSLFERMGGTFYQEGDYFLPDLATPGISRYRHMGPTAETVSERTPSGPLYGSVAV